MTTKKPSYAELLERHEKASEKQAARSKKFLEKKAAAGMKRFQIWLPEALLKQEYEGKGRKVGTILFLDGDDKSDFTSYYRDKKNQVHQIWPPQPAAPQKEAGEKKQAQ